MAFNILNKIGSDPQMPDMDRLVSSGITDALSSDGKRISGAILDSGEAPDERSVPSFLRIEPDQIALLVNGKQGFVINKDGVKKSGNDISNGLPNASKNPLWEENIAIMTFVPSTMFTPMPKALPRNPLDFILTIVRMLG